MTLLYVKKKIVENIYMFWILSPTVVVFFLIVKVYYNISNIKDNKFSLIYDPFPSTYKIQVLLYLFLLLKYLILNKMR